MKFSSVILLFGEYLIWEGAVGLAYPYSKFCSELIMPDYNAVLNHDNLDSNSLLKKLAIEISHNSTFRNKSKISQFLEDTLCGLYFESNIPIDCGFGSSGALTASIYHTYFNDIENGSPDHANLKKIQHELSIIESFFKKPGTGIIPLVSYLNQPVLFNAPIHIENMVAPKTFKLVVIDTKKSATTDTLIEKFNKIKNKQPDMINELLRKNNRCILAITHHSPNCYDVISNFCEAEHNLLPDMFKFPDGFVDLFVGDRNKLAIKLLGLGGDGYLMAFIKNENFSSICAKLKSHHIHFETVSLNESSLICI